MLEAALPPTIRSVYLSRNLPSIRPIARTPVWTSGCLCHSAANCDCLKERFPMICTIGCCGSFAPQSRLHADHMITYIYDIDLLPCTVTTLIMGCRSWTPLSHLLTHFALVRAACSSTTRNRRFSSQIQRIASGLLYLLRTLLCQLLCQ